MTVYEKKTSIWTPKTLLVLWGMTMLFILAVCALGVWWTK